MNLQLRTAPLRHLVLVCLVLATPLTIYGCHKAPAPANVPAAKDTEEKDNDKAAISEEATGVSLKPEEIKKMGIVTTQAQAIMHSPEATGFAVVLAHESIAAAAADLDIAAASERQSRAALVRTQRLAGTAGAMPVDTLEGFERQAAVDQVALELSRSKLSSLFGRKPPWKNQSNSPLLRALANGNAQLVRVSFPLGATGDELPSSLRLAHIDASQGGKSVETHSVWSAPADASVPGRSYFAYLKSGGFGEGERLLAWVPTGEAQAGVLVPAAAAVINGGRFWCYVEAKTGLFVRMELDPSSSSNDGYFVKEGIEAGAKIVTVAAGQLLAREINPSSAVAD